MMGNHYAGGPSMFYESMTASMNISAERQHEADWNAANRLKMAALSPEERTRLSGELDNNQQKSATIGSWIEVPLRQTGDGGHVRLDGPYDAEKDVVRRLERFTDHFLGDALQKHEGIIAVCEKKDTGVWAIQGLIESQDITRDTSEIFKVIEQHKQNAAKIFDAIASLGEEQSILYQNPSFLEGVVRKVFSSNWFIDGEKYQLAFMIRDSAYEAESGYQSVDIHNLAKLVRDRDVLEKAMTIIQYVDGTTQLEPYEVRYPRDARNMLRYY